MIARQWSDGEREAWHEQQRDAVPDVVELDDVRGVVKRGRKCSECGITMPPGTPFRRFVCKVDGVFMAMQTCLAHPMDPLGCDAWLRHKGLERCPACKGAGVEPSWNRSFAMPETICARCNGRGTRPITSADGASEDRKAEDSRTR